MSRNHMFSISDYYFLSDAYRVSKGYNQRTVINLDEEVQIDTLYRATLCVACQDKFGLFLKPVDEVFVTREEEIVRDALTSKEYSLFEDGVDYVTGDFVITSMMKVKNDGRNSISRNDILHYVFDDQVRLEKLGRKTMFDYDSMGEEDRSFALNYMRDAIDSTIRTHGYYARRRVHKC